mgnify:CR=1 FL=1
MAVLPDFTNYGKDSVDLEIFPLLVKYTRFRGVKTEENLYSVGDANNAGVLEQPSESLGPGVHELSEVFEASIEENVVNSEEVACGEQQQRRPLV